MPRFYSLTVTDLQRLTRDAVAVSLAPLETDLRAFDFIQGQYLTFRRVFDGIELRRSYSICAGVDDGQLRVGIKQVEGGVFSTWVNEALKIGDTVEAMPPMGNFYTAANASANKSYLGIAGGSGITPVLSLVRTLLTREPGSRFTLIYANRSLHSIMFREELEDLKNSYMGRLSVLHILESESQQNELFGGRLNKQKCSQLFSSWIDIASIDTAFICGPESMMHMLVDSLKAHGLRDEQIKFELFSSGQPGRAATRAKSRKSNAQQSSCTATVLIDGSSRIISVNWEGQSMLEAALAANIDAPYACKAGICSTCRAQVLEGELEMVSNHALEDYEVEKGFVLTCQCYPVSNTVTLSYDR